MISLPQHAIYIWPYIKVHEVDSDTPYLVHYEDGVGYIGFSYQQCLNLLNNTNTFLYQQCLNLLNNANTFKCFLN